MGDADELRRLRRLADAVVDFIATVDGAFVQYGRGATEAGLAAGRAMLHDGIAHLRTALRASRPEGK